MTLKPGQFQIGNFVFGRDTLFNVEKMEILGYDVSVQDFQTPSSDVLRFGSDSLKPLPIQFSINAFSNRTLGNVAALTRTGPQSFSSDPTVLQFVQEWKSDATRQNWGELKPLLFCRDDGSVVMVFGRPGKMAVSLFDPTKSCRKIVAEFRRSDTLAYSAVEKVVTPTGTPQTVARSSVAGMGNAPSWLRFLLTGPMSYPIIQLGWTTVQLSAAIQEGDVVEISSYPWARRVISLGDGLSYAAAYTSETPLSKLLFAADTVTMLSWNATGTNENSKCQMTWRDAWYEI